MLVYSNGLNVDKEIVEMIKDTDLEYMAYCKGKDCMPELCPIKRN